MVGWQPPHAVRTPAGPLHLLGSILATHLSRLRILARCATVAEAEAVFRDYNLFTLDRVRFLLADASGASTVVEWRDGELRCLPRGDPDRNDSVADRHWLQPAALADEQVLRIPPQGAAAM